jgi:signal transduction histidine kinase
MTLLSRRYNPAPMRRSFFTLPVYLTATCAWMLIASFEWLKNLVALGPTASALAPVSIWLTTQSMLLWGVFSLLILTATQQLDFEKGKRLKSLALHVLLALAINLTDVAIDTIVNLFTRLEYASYADRFNGEVFINTFSYVLVAAVGYALVYHQRLVDSRLNAAELQRQLAQARLEALARTLQPHFLFNALNSVAALVRLNEYPRALQAVVALGDLLRTVLTTRGEAIVSLNEELEFIERYVAVERLRFEEQMKVEYDIQPDARPLPLPALILQPLVENAIRHGVENSGHGRVRIVARHENGGLMVEVGVHDLALTPDAKVTGLGIGLDVTRRRLTYLYGEDKCRLDLLVSSKYSTVTLRIPDARPHTDSHRG